MPDKSYNIDEMRIERMRENTDILNDAGLYRSSAYALIGGSLRSTAGQPVQIRRAKAIAYLLDNTKINIFPDEPIVGSMVGLWSLDKNLLDYNEQKCSAINAIENYLTQRVNVISTGKSEIKHKSLEEEVSEKQSRWALMSRVHHDASLNYTDYQRMLGDMEEHFTNRSIERYEIGKILESTLRIRYAPEDIEVMNSLPWLPGNHLGLDYEAVLLNGLGKMHNDIKTYHSLANDPEKIEFYESVDIVISAMSGFFTRFAEKARSMAMSGNESEKRKQELLLIAASLEKMSTDKAESFREALQAVWLLHVMSNIIGGSAMSFSRFDQYMLPFYEIDIKNGISREEIKSLLYCFWLKINEPKLRTVQSLTVGGKRPDGSDACNGLTRLCLEVASDMKLPYPNIGVRVSSSSPEWLYDAIIATIKAGCGQPMILNDDVFITNFKKLGYTESLANDYFNMGCVELMIQGKQPLWGMGGDVVYTECLQQTLDAFVSGRLKADTFDEFIEYFLDCVRRDIKRNHEDVLKRKKSMENCYDPFCSILTQNCIERGQDMHHGGSACPAHWSIYAHGLGTLADSLASIKKFVYDDNKISLNRLIEALDANFKGYEDIHIILDRGTPCFGNEIDDTDDIASRVFYELTKSIFELNTPEEEDRYVATFFSYFTHVLSGEIAKATPNGRLAGQSLSDSMAPTQGKDINGPTKMLNSILKLDSSYVTGGYALNIKVNPSLLKDPQGEAALKSLLKAYIIGLGPQIQVNFVDADALKEAQVNPDKHRNIVVRVGGFCEYFVNLDKVLQNEIIERTVHDAV